MADGSRPNGAMPTDDGLTMLIPAFNEEALLEVAVPRIRAAAASIGLPFELVVVDDGSADRTGEILDRLAAADPSIHALHHPQNLGLGGALTTGARHARYDRIIWSPVDSPIPPEQVRTFLAAWTPQTVVVGVRPARLGYRRWQHSGSTIYHRLASALLGLHLRDMNWIHMYPRRLFSEIDLDFTGIVYLAEVLAKAQRLGYRLVEVEAPMVARIKGVATISKPRVLWHTFWDLWRLWWRMRRFRGRTA